MDSVSLKLVTKSQRYSYNTARRGYIIIYIYIYVCVFDGPPDGVTGDWLTRFQRGKFALHI